MEVLVILGSIIAVGALGWGSVQVHRYSMTRYDYSPFRVLIAIGFCVSVIIFFIGLILIPDGYNLAGMLNSLQRLEVPSGGLNSIVLLLLSILGAVAIGAYLESKTDIWVALYGAFILLAASVIVIALVILWHMNRSSNRTQQNSSRR